METLDVRQGFVPSKKKSLGLWRPTTYSKVLFLQEKGMGLWRPTTYGKGLFLQKKKLASVETHDVRQGVIPSLKVWVCGDLRRTAR